MLDFDVPDLNAPFATLNLHKWIGALLGCGAIYTRRDKLDAIDPYLATVAGPPTISARACTPVRRISRRG